MGISYYEAASLLFGDRPFTSREFGMRTASRRSAKTLSELKMLGLAVRLERGRYRLLAPGDRPDRRAREWSRVRSLLLNSPLPMAWAGPSAVELWTGHRYFVSPSVFVREWHIEVPRDSVAEWTQFLHHHRVSTDRNRGLGNKVVLHPVRRLRRVSLHGEPVIPRKAVLRLIRAHRGIYAEADRLVVNGPRLA